MSKTSPKQRYKQLKLWLEARDSGGTSAKKPRKFSKSDHYKKTRERYGFKKSN